MLPQRVGNQFVLIELPQIGEDGGDDRLHVFQAQAGLEQQHEQLFCQRLLALLEFSIPRRRIVPPIIRHTLPLPVGQAHNRFYSTKGVAVIDFVPHTLQLGLQFFRKTAFLSRNLVGFPLVVEAFAVVVIGDSAAWEAPRSAR